MSLLAPPTATHRPAGELRLVRRARPASAPAEVLPDARRREAWLARVRHDLLPDDDTPGSLGTESRG